MLRRTLLFTALVFGLMSSRSLVGQTSGVSEGALVTSHPSDRIINAIDDEQRTVLSGNRHPLARPQFDQGAAPAGHRMERMIMSLRADASQQTALAALIEAQRTPGSPQYHQWISPQRYAEYFGASSNDLQQLTNWLASHGFAVEAVTPGSHSIIFSGTAMQVESAFHTPIHIYQVGGAVHYANAADPEIPSALAGIVAGIVSMHDFPSKPMHTTVQAPLDQASTGSRIMTPADFAVIYDLTSLHSSGINGSGQTLAIVGRTDINLSDIRLFRNTYGLTANDPQIALNGADPGIVSADEEAEADLDVEWAGAVAPGATIQYVISSSTGASDGALLSAEYIVDNNLASVMSMSFGLCESALGTTENAFLNDLWQKAAAEGMTVIVASGDSGAAGCDAAGSTLATAGLAVNGLASTPYNISVGGTMFEDGADPSLYWSSTNTSTTQASALRYIPESVWNESGANGLWASGGGVSTIYPKPSWQVAQNVPADGQRDVPDVSLTAAGHDGYPIYINGSLAVVGGTSAAAPSFAGMMAMVVQSTNTRQGNANPVLYTLATRQETAGGAAVFHNVTAGNNSVPGLVGYSAQTGYDLATGLGSVDAGMLVKHWGDAASPAPEFLLSTSASAVSVIPGATAKLTLGVQVSGGFNAPVVLSTPGLPLGFYTNFAPLRFAAPGSGTSTLQVIVATTVATGAYKLTIDATGSGMTQTAVLTVNVVAAPPFAITLAPAAVSVIAGHKAVIAISTAAGPGFNQDISLSAGAFPSGTAAFLWPKIILAPGSGSSTLTLFVPANAPAGSYTTTISAFNRKVVVATAELTITVVPAPTFWLNPAASTVNIVPGYTSTVEVNTSINGTFAAAVSLSASGLPAGVTAAVAPTSIAAPGSGMSTVTFTAASTAAPGSYSVDLTGTGGGVIQQSSVILMIDNPTTSVPPPLLFYTDLDSGPATGGEGGVDGAFLCLYGQNFGSPQNGATVTIGGVEVASYKYWADGGSPYSPGSYAKACVQVSHLTPAGLQNVQLTNAVGTSNLLPFTVRPGAILWVAAGGSDKNAGTQGSPFASIVKCKNVLPVGGICVIGESSSDSLVFSSANNLSSCDALSESACIGLILNTSGTAGNPKAIVAYPGATATIDMHNVCPNDICGRPLETGNAPLWNASIEYWTIAGLTFNGNSFSIDIEVGGHHRFIDNDFMCTGDACDYNSGNGGGLHAGGWPGSNSEGNGAVTYLAIFGNRIHDVGCHEDPDYANSQHPCNWHTVSGAFTSSGITVTFVDASSAHQGQVVQVAGQTRMIIFGSCHGSGTLTCTIDTPFSPEVSASSFQYRVNRHSKLYHNVYFSTNTNHVWFAWNDINGNGNGCRGLQFNSTDGNPQYDLHIYDNAIHETVCDGINFASVDPSKGVVEAYNNLIYNAGNGPDPGDGAANYTCTYNAGGGDAITSGSGDIRIYNNTLYNCGNNPWAEYPSDRGAIASNTGWAPNLRLVLTNNVIDQPSLIPYQSKASNGTLTGSFNDCYGSGIPCPATFGISNFDFDPKFVNPIADNFHLQKGSPASLISTSTPANECNLDGLLQGPLHSLGAY